MPPRGSPGAWPRLHAEDRGWRTEGLSAAETASSHPGPGPEGLSETETSPHHGMRRIPFGSAAVFDAVDRDE